MKESGIGIGNRKKVGMIWEACGRNGIGME